MEILTPLQNRFLSEFAKSSLCRDFFLTGGTALSAFYLKHRYSEDLDFFTDLPTLLQAPLPLQEIAKDLGVSIVFRRTFPTFLECFMEGDGERIKLDFACDAPFRLKPKRFLEEERFFIDNLTDMACNKVSAFFDRMESKDYVDLYFLDKEYQDFEKIVLEARKKHVGLDDYWLAQACYRSTKLTKLPRMIKPVSLEELQAFFTGKAKSFMAQLSDLAP